MRILMMSQTAGVAKVVTRGLTAEGWRVECAHSFDAALDEMRSEPYDVLLIDIAEYENDSRDVQDLLSKAPSALPVLLLTAGHPAQLPFDHLGNRKVEVLEKPFAFDELIARIEALGYKSPSEPSDTLGLGHSLVFDRAKGRICLGQTDIPLSDTECRLLDVLAQNQGRTCATSWLLETVWHERDAPFSCPVEVTVQSLRRKLGPHAAMITTIRHYGYRFEAPAERTD